LDLQNKRLDEVKLKSWTATCILMLHCSFIFLFLFESDGLMASSEFFSGAVSSEDWTGASASASGAQWGLNSRNMLLRIPLTRAFPWNCFSKYYYGKWAGLSISLWMVAWLSQIFHKKYHHRVVSLMRQ
jgi:hypothetical protein